MKIKTIIHTSRDVFTKIWKLSEHVGEGLSLRLAGGSSPFVDVLELVALYRPDDYRGSPKSIWNQSRMFRDTHPKSIKSCHIRNWSDGYVEVY